MGSRPLVAVDSRGPGIVKRAALGSASTDVLRSAKVYQAVCGLLVLV
jgi:nucleotide-binding universal stress UspA family protein